MVMTEERNGRDVSVPPIRPGEFNDATVHDLGTFYPETATVTINGVAYMCWVAKNRRYPRPLKARADAAWNKYNRVAQIVLDTPSITAKEGTPEFTAQVRDREIAMQDPDVLAAIDAHDEAYQNWLTDELCIFVPDLPRKIAEIMDVEVVRAALTNPIGYLTPPKAENTKAEPTDEVSEPDPLAGTGSPPSSRRSTRSTRQKSS